MSLPHAEKMTEWQVERRDSGTKELKESEEHPIPPPQPPHPEVWFVGGKKHPNSNLQNPKVGQQQRQFGFQLQDLR